MKKKLLIFSQCYIFGGSERLMSSIYGSDLFNSLYDIQYCYGYSKNYESSLNRYSQVFSMKNKHSPVFLLFNGDLFYRIDCSMQNSWIRRVLKLPFFLLEKSGLYFIWNFIQLFLMVRKFKPEILHINNGGFPAARSCNELVVVMYFFRKIKVVYQVNNTSMRSSSILALWRKEMVNKRVGNFITHSRENGVSLRNIGMDSNKIVSFTSYFIEQKREIKIIESADFDVLKFNVCMVASLTSRKGQLELLYALLEIRKSNLQIFNKLSVNLVGEGENRRSLEAFVETNNLRQFVKFWGHREDYELLIENCDLLAVTSIENEDLPLVLISGLKLGKCIIATNFVGISENCSHLLDTYLIEKNSKNFQNELAIGLIKLIQDSSLREDLAKNARRTYEINFSEQNYFVKMNQVYLNLIG